MSFLIFFYNINLRAGSRGSSSSNKSPKEYRASNCNSNELTYLVSTLVQKLSNNLSFKVKDSEKRKGISFCCLRKRF